MQGRSCCGCCGSCGSANSSKVQQPQKWRLLTIQNGGRLGKKLWVSIVAVVVGGGCFSAPVALPLSLWGHLRMET
eukprot:1770701-Ditylum_brightwellii.AAC.1